MSGGQWTLHYDWGYTENYFQAEMNLNGDGTLSLPPNRTARWVENDGKIMWRLDNSPTVYSGDIIGQSMVGIMSTFQGRNGCWYATKGFSPTMAFEAHKPELDVAGNTTSATLW
jgi:hypothetical protein